MSTIAVLDSTMFYREAGTGTPIVFLHGNPTSSYLWREILPVVADLGRCLAPDLIGMGASGKPDIDYTFDDHARYLDAWIDALGLQSAVFVGHDWGGSLAFDWATRHPDRVNGVAFMETFVRPLSWTEFPEAARELFAAIRTPGVGEQMVLQKNLFLEQALPFAVKRDLTSEELEVYRRPYPSPESRRPLLQWPRSIPFDGEPPEVVERIAACGRWLSASEDVPKLLFTFEPGPGLMMTPELQAWCESNITALQVAHLGPAGHHAPEDQSPAIAAELTRWLHGHKLVSVAAQPLSARTDR
jgi:haloalkane dehalogenase